MATLFYEEPRAALYVGDALDALSVLPSASAQCCVTSPPYWGLRDYGHPGQLGLESTPEEYVAALVAVFREVRRVLRPDGVLWLNLGDSYASETKGSGGTGKSTLVGTPNDGNGQLYAHRKVTPGLPSKNLVGIPWRVAFALQADGWWLRSDTIWAKPNPMPESVTDRPTKAHEYVFLLSKAESYFYNAENARERATAEPKPRGPKNDAGRNDGGRVGIVRGDGMTRNWRTVWDIASQPYDGAHFATMPPELARRCIVAGTRPGDVVLDPFNGAGTTGMVAMQQGRRYVGVELNPDYARLSVERWREHASQGVLFAGGL